MSLLDDVLSKLEALPEDAKRELTKEALKATSHMLWVPNPGPQTEAYFSLADELYFGGEVGGGKGFCSHERVLTPTGWREIGKLKIGSLVCASDGTVTKIIGYFPRGEQPLYKIRFLDGSEIVCDEDHIWLAWENQGSRKIANNVVSGTDSAKKWFTKDIFSYYQKGGPRLSIPVLEKPARFNVAGGFIGRGNFIGRVVPPYTLGVILGDGCISSQKRGVSFTSQDCEIAERVEAELGVELHRYTVNENTVSYRIPSQSIVPGISALRLWGAKSNTKYIPRQYLFAPVEDRWALIQGLMDTDGWADTDGDCYFCSVSDRLIEDVTHLARSLGAYVTRREKIPTYLYDGVLKIGQKAFTIRIKMPEPERMFHLSRKADRCRGKVSQSMGRAIESIEPHGIGKTVCIAVEHPRSLYVVRDFIVTHNTDLIIGLALTAHKNSLMLRRINDDARGLADRTSEILGNSDGLNRTLLEWRLKDRFLEFGGCQLESDKQRYKGRPRDLIGIDEGADFLESQFEFIKIWNRSSDPDQRCRVVIASNPPSTAEGLWIVQRWSAWLDPAHLNPAKCGELRWYMRNDGGKEVEVDGPGPHPIGGEMIRATSRTFIRSRLEDNPNYAKSNYKDRIHLLPEDLQKIYRGGDFSVANRDQPNQVIPTAWVLAANKRWTPYPPRDIPMVSIGVDPSGGGQDPMIISRRYDWWFDELLETQGKDLPQERMGKFTTGTIVSYRKDGALVVLDMGGGYGGAILETLAENQINVLQFKGSEGTTVRTRNREHGFFNVRSAAIWKFREALDPDQDGGSPIALPTDQVLLADLTAPTFEVGTRGIQVEPKENILKRLGRSTNKGDAVVMSWYGGGSFLSGQRMPMRNVRPQVITNRMHRRR